VGPYDVVAWWLEKSPKSQPAAVPDALVSCGTERRMKGVSLA
jgi:hypothetical protein